MLIVSTFDFDFPVSSTNNTPCPSLTDVIPVPNASVRRRFLDPRPSPTSNAKPSKKLENTKVLVTTDLGSRGIDTLAVRNVILYDVPHTTIDFVHRLGRLGRMGRRGRAIALVGKKDRKDVVSEVRHAMFRGQALI